MAQPGTGKILVTLDNYEKITDEAVEEHIAKLDADWKLFRGDTDFHNELAYKQQVESLRRIGNRAKEYIARELTDKQSQL